MQKYSDVSKNYADSNNERCIEKSSLKIGLNLNQERLMSFGRITSVFIWKESWVARLKMLLWFSWARLFECYLALPLSNVKYFYCNPINSQIINQHSTIVMSKSYNYFLNCSIKQPFKQPLNNRVRVTCLIPTFDWNTFEFRNQRNWLRNPAFIFLWLSFFFLKHKSFFRTFVKSNLIDAIRSNKGEHCMENAWNALHGKW